MVGYTDITTSIEDKLLLVRKLAKTKRTVIIDYGAHDSQIGPWRITDCSYTVKHRRDPDGAITRADLSLTFTKASNLELKLGPTTGGHTSEMLGYGEIGTTGLNPDTDDWGNIPKGRNRPGDATHRTYTVKQGDTLYSIAKKFYGTQGAASYIMDFNDLKRIKLRVGRVLKIPRTNKPEGIKPGAQPGL
jgi:LysM repeat protein